MTSKLPTPTFITDEVSRSLPEAIEFALEQNVPAIELRMIGDTNIVDLPAADLRRVRESLSAAGLGVAAIATPLFKCPLSAENDDGNDPFRPRSQLFEDHLELVPRALEVATELGTNLLRCFAFLGVGAYAPVRDQIVERLRRAGETVGAERFILAIENEPSTFVRTTTDLADLLNELGPPFAALWDPGNAYSIGERGDLLGYPEIARYVAHIHLKDPVTRAHGEPAFVALGEGEIDYARHVRAWLDDGYEGYLSLEPHLVIGESSIEGSRRSLAHVRGLLDATVPSATVPSGRLDSR